MVIQKEITKDDTYNEKKALRKTNTGKSEN
jgi:hypothetical protein